MDSIYLSDHETEALEKLMALHQQRCSVNELLEYCHSLQSKIRDKTFTYLYLAILLAKKGCVEESINILSQYCSEQAFSAALMRYLKVHGNMLLQEKVFSDPRAYSAWTKTEYYNDYCIKSADAVVNFMKQYPPAASKKISILDIGTGNGVFIVEVLNCLTKILKLGHIEVILIDQSEDMLKIASQYCHEKINHKNIMVTTLNCKIQNMDRHQLEKLLQFQPYWFVLGALSLHHMPRNTKVKTIRTLSELAKFVLILDAEANHDLPDENAPEFVYSLIQHCDYYISNILCSKNISEEEKWLCIDQFILAEALVMLANTRENRIDYHAPQAQWQTVAMEAGMKPILAKTMTQTPQGRALSFFLALTQKNIQHSGTTA